MLKLLTKTLLLLLLSISIFSCSRYIGYGVIKISEDENILESGTLISITKESRIRDTWVYSTNTDDHIEIEQWRVNFFKKIDQAKEYQEEYKKYKNYFAVVTRDSHTMRSSPVASATQVYRLKENQRVKIIGRTAKKEQIARFDGYWWQLITEDGIEGWTYDSYLNIFNGSDLVHGKIIEDGPEIDNFFVTTWRPNYFLEMIESRNIDLDKFKTNYGLFPDLDKKEIIISMPDHYVVQKFTEIVRTGPNNYLLEGSSIQLDFSFRSMVLVSYSQDYKSHFNRFVSLAANVNNVISSEIAKRNIRFNEFIFNGPIFESRAFGQITFLEGNNFLWSNNTNLKTQQLLTNNAGETGKVAFKTFLAPGLATKYDGSITFDFGESQELTFLYTFEGNNLRFLYVPLSSIKDNLILNDNFFTPIQLFFTGN